MELRDESQTGILFCQLECANGNVRAARKLMNLMGEMPPLSRTPDQLPLSFLSADVFRCYFLIVFSAWPGCLLVRV